MLGGLDLPGPEPPETQYRQLRNQPLNDQYPELRVTVLQELDATGKISEWVSERYGTGGGIEARKRWQIENAAFKTLKESQGPHFEHNHGHVNLAS